MGPSVWHGGGAFVSTDLTLPPRLGGHLPDTFGFHIYDILIITFFLICYNDVNKIYNRGVLTQNFMDQIVNMKFKRLPKKKKMKFKQKKKKVNMKKEL